MFYDGSNKKLIPHAFFHKFYNLFKLKLNMNWIAKNLIFILILFSTESCVNLKNARYFKPIDSTELKYMPMEDREYSMHPTFTYLEKNIIDSQSNKVGELILEVYSNSNEEYLKWGVFFPLFRANYPSYKNFPNDDIMRIAMNFYDSCSIFTNLNEKSFLIQINDEPNRVIYSEYFDKDNKDCQLKKINKTKSIKYSITYFFRSEYPIGKIETVKLIPLDSEAKQIISTTRFKKENKVYRSYFYGPR
jgi:hypothetical protein